MKTPHTASRAFAVVELAGELHCVSLLRGVKGGGGRMNEQRGGRKIGLKRPQGGQSVGGNPIPDRVLFVIVVPVSVFGLVTFRFCVSDPMVLGFQTIFESKTGERRSVDSGSYVKWT